MALPAAPTDPGSAFGAGDPRNALYFQHLAALEHQYSTKLAGGAESLASARAKAVYQQGALDRQEPAGLENTRNRANSEGLLHSGVLAGRAGALQAQYAQKGGQITSGLQETEGRIGRGEQSAKEALESGRSEAATKALGEGYESLLKNPPSPEAAPAGGGGVPAKVSYQPGGTVTIGGRPGPPIGIASERAQPSSAGVRRSAGERYLARARAKARL